MNLSFIQKKVICDVARKAYDRWPGHEEFERNQAPGLNCFDAWRHAEQLKAVGVQSLSLCKEEHYKRLVAHFSRIRGRRRAEAENELLPLFNP